MDISAESNKVLDPVMGDEGELYVDESVVPVYKTLMPSADLLIPNLFELEYVFLPAPLLTSSLPADNGLNRAPTSG